MTLTLFQSLVAMAVCTVHKAIPFHIATNGPFILFKSAVAAASFTMIVN